MAGKELVILQGQQGIGTPECSTFGKYQENDSRVQGAPMIIAFNQKQNSFYLQTLPNCSFN